MKIKNNIPANNLVDHMERFNLDIVETACENMAGANTVRSKGTTNKKIIDTSALMKSIWYKKIGEIQNNKGKMLLYLGNGMIEVDKK
jgi:hypothetical protein